jgi:hypothetical protein
MKALIVVVGLSLAMCQADAQKVKSNEVPAAVKNSLHKAYSMKDADWDKEGDSFEANFEQNGKEISVLFDASGTVLEAETEIKKNELPQSVLEMLKKDYSAYEIEETAKIESKGEISYEVEVEKGKQTFDLIFDANGKLVKKLSKKDEEKD